MKYALLFLLLVCTSVSAQDYYSKYGPLPEGKVLVVYTNGRDDSGINLFTSGRNGINNSLYVPKGATVEFFTDRSSMVTAKILEGTYAGNEQGIGPMYIFDTWDDSHYMLVYSCATPEGYQNTVVHKMPYPKPVSAFLEGLGYGLGVVGLLIVMKFSKRAWKATTAIGD